MLSDFRLSHNFTLSERYKGGFHPVDSCLSLRGTPLGADFFDLNLSLSSEIPSHYINLYTTISFLSSHLWFSYLSPPLEGKVLEGKDMS